MTEEAVELEEGWRVVVPPFPFPTGVINTRKQKLPRGLNTTCLGPAAIEQNKQGSGS